MTNAQNMDFQAPPSTDGSQNLVARTPRTLYLNKPRNLSDDVDPLEAAATATVQPDAKSNTSPSPEHDWEKRYSDLKSYHDKQVNTLRADTAEKDRLLANKEKELKELKAPVKFPTTPEEEEAFRKQYGPLTSMIETLAMRKIHSSQSDLKEVMQQNEQRTKQLLAERAKQKLLGLHPDADDIKDDPAFHDWFSKQIPAIQNLLNSDSVEEVSRGLDIYKKDKGLITKTHQQKEEERLAAATQVVTKPIVDIGQGGGKIWRASEVKSIPMSQYSKYAAEIDKALIEGRYDPNS